VTIGVGRVGMNRRELDQRFVCFLPRHRWTPNTSPTRQGDSRDISRILMGIVSGIPAARAKLAKAMAFVRDRQRFGMMELRRTLGLPTNGTRAFPDRVYR